ncbi:MAG: CBS domain-containing protein, partial [Bacteroidetes bacterium]|nr:CBS domain-containing protein [Bacteroidota bacterium]
RRFATARDIIAHKAGNGLLYSIPKDMVVEEAIKIMNKQGISQIPVVDQEDFVGSLIDSHVLNKLIDDPGLKHLPVSEVMDESFQFVGLDNTIDVLSSLIDSHHKALLVRDEQDRVHIITQHDLLMAMSDS